MSALTFEELEAAYDLLARAIDTAGPDRQSLFLAKLALVLAHETGDAALFRRAVATAVEDIGPTAEPPGN
jgi:hypothetical protein